MKSAYGPSAPQARITAIIPPTQSDATAEPTDDLKDWVVALPPMDEQQQILSKVRELTALDEMEEALNEEQKAASRSAATTVEAIFQ